MGKATLYISSKRIFVKNIYFSPLGSRSTGMYMWDNPPEAGQNQHHRVFCFDQSYTLVWGPFGSAWGQARVRRGLGGAAGKINDSYHISFYLFFPVQATTLTFEGVRINPYATFMGPSPFRDVGSWTTTCIFNRADVENEILKYREWLTYILCLADGGPKWSHSKSQLVSRAF